MPLQSGNSNKAKSQNIHELMSGYSAKGSIGTSNPPNKAAALKQAIAIAMSKAGEGHLAKKKAKKKAPPSHGGGMMSGSGMPPGMGM